MEKKRSLDLQIKDNWFFIFSFIPLLQWIPFFMMNGRLPKKKWIIMGFAHIICVVAAILLLVFSDAFYNYMPDSPAGRPEYPERPTVSDFCGDYYFEDPNYEQTPEYAQYEEAMDEYYKSDEYKQYEADMDAYYESPEYKAYEKERGRVYSIQRGLDSAANVTMFFTWLLFLILGFFVERYRYKRGLEVNRNRGSVYSQLTNRTGTAVAGQETKREKKRFGRRKPKPAEPVTQTSTAAVSQSAPVNISSNASTDENVKKININTATEEELMTLPAMKTIDAKKIINYRIAHNGFKSIDDFFEAYEAKPHIMVKTMKLITLDEDNGEVSTSGTTTSVTSNEKNEPVNKPSDIKRRFDL